MARRAFIGVNVRTDGIRRKEGRAEITPGGRGGQGIRVVNRPLEKIPRLDETPRDKVRDFISRPFDEKEDVKPQTVNGFPVDIELSSPGQGDKKGDEIISDNDLREIKKDKDLIISPPPPPPPGPLYEDLPDIKSGLGVLGSGGAKPQEILGLDITTKKKKKFDLSDLESLKDEDEDNDGIEWIKKKDKSGSNKWIQKKAEGGLMNLGGREMDLRADGGFIPIGSKEKADDVPARLSKNEFVMTADAVRGAGNGSIERGAQKMYNTMKQLENRVV